jgi:4-amino-4-deoxy-L-arabinose transferase-like glycosyltransferase
MAGLAAKENLLIALVIAGTGLCFKALDPATRRPFLIALSAGVALGLGALTQPAVLILLFVVPVGYRFALAALGRRRFVARIAVIVAGAAIAIAPWMARNCIVFEGEFCGISTNGGPVFWRANNPNSTGVFMTGGRDSPLQGLSEVERNRHGYELGRQWILAHPFDAAKLTVRKEFAYLGGDDYGAYWSVLRGAGGNEDVAMRDASEGRIVLYRLASALSLAYWVLLAALCAQAIWRWPSTDSHQGRVLPPLIYPLLCGVVVFGIFESGDRQHMFAVGPLIVLAAAGIAQRLSVPDAAASGAPHR